MHILEQSIRKASQAGRTALIPFVTAGFPTPEQFWDVLDQLDASGVDVIEIGVPFSDPVADGPVVEAASVKALQHNITLEYILEGLAQRSYITPLVLMGYYNPFLQYGLERFAATAAAAGIAGCIVPDLPLHEDLPLRNALTAQDIALIALVGPNTDDARMQDYAQHSQGYVYVVSLLGTTGVRTGLPQEAAHTIQRAKHIFPVPVALGFGLHSPDQLASLSQQERPHAAVFGSALLQHLAEGKQARDFISLWK